MIGTEDPKKLASFYEQVFERKADMVDGDFYGWDFNGMSFSFGPHDKIKGRSKEPDRILLNFETSDVQKEFERLAKVEGIEVVKEPYTMDGYPEFYIATLSDPDGNYFQLMSPWEA